MGERLSNRLRANSSGCRRTSRRARVKDARAPLRLFDRSPASFVVGFWQFHFGRCRSIGALFKCPLSLSER